MDAILIVNKPKGCTSHDIVYKVKKIFNEKVGHTGTLDPLATGVLPLLIGKGTLCAKYLVNHDKKYRATIKLGEKTDTADSEGNIIEEKQIKRELLKKENIEEIFRNMIGKQLQVPPIYSAIKVNGKKLYEYARKGQTVEIASREIEIYNLNLLNINENLDEIEFEVTSSKGTYIRSLCENISEKLETVGYMKELKRLEVGEFKIQEAIDIDELEMNKDNIEILNKYCITLEELLKDKERIDIDDRKLGLFLNGVKLTFELGNGMYRIYNSNQFIGIGIVENNLLKRDIVV